MDNHFTGTNYYEAFTAEDATLIQLTLDEGNTSYERVDNPVDSDQKSVRFYVSRKDPFHYERIRENVVDRSLLGKDLNEKFESTLAGYQKMLL